MKKYYIPTSSLNFNNILSTESISPKYFYEKRNFGYTRWYTINENDRDNLILLYDAPHEFTRQKCDMEDHPMLIELETDVEFKRLKDGVYCSYETIYLNPWQTTFIFFSDRVRTIVLSLSDSSLETKMLRLYKKRMIVNKYTGYYPSLEDVDFDNSIKQTESFIEKDRNINKMKGLLYGFYIGANLSSSVERISRLDTLRKIQDIFSAVVSSYNKTLSKTQEDELSELFILLDKQSALWQKFKQELEKKDDNAIIKFLQSYGVKFDKRNVMNSLVTTPNSAITWIKAEIAEVNKDIDNHQKLLDPNEKQIVVSELQLKSQKIVTDEVLSCLYSVWVNEVLKLSQYNGNISSFNDKLSDAITLKTREVLGNNWEHSYYRTYLNDLRRHIGGNKFNQDWSNGLLSSMAAVLIKGDDWKILLHFMQSKGMYDYRIAFSFYGILNGFANLTRDFTDLLLDKPNDYVAKVYKEFYFQLFKKNIPEYTGKKKLNTDIEDKQITDCLGEMLQIVEQKVKNKKCLKSFVETMRQCDPNISIEKFLDMLKEHPEWQTEKTKKPKKVWTYLKERFGNFQNSLWNDKDIVDSEKDCIIGYQTMENDRSILSDYKLWIKDCLSLIEDKKAREQFETDTEWFVENHQESYRDVKKGLQKGCYSEKDKSNYRVILRFKAYMEKKRKFNPKCEWIANIYRNIPVDEIINYLKKRYSFKEN